MFISIQAKWEMEEKARIVLKWDWIIPPNAPRIADRKIKNTISVIWGFRIKLSGASFCHVKRIESEVQLEVFATWGTHQWKGAAPTFNIIAVRRIGLTRLIRLTWLRRFDWAVKEKMIRADPIACTRKYLMVDSMVLVEFLKKINGINPIKLISNPNHP